MEGSRDFGDVFLGLTLWKMLGLGDLLDKEIPRGTADVPWGNMACLLTLARFLQELRGIKANEVILPTSTGKEIRLSCVTRPQAPLRALLQRMGMVLPALVAATPYTNLRFGM